MGDGGGGSQTLFGAGKLCQNVWARYLGQDQYSLGIADEELSQCEY